MPKYRIGSKSSFVSEHGDDFFASLIPGFQPPDEASAQFKDYGPHVYEDMYGWISSHSGGFTCSYEFTDDGTASTNLVASGTAVGVVEDNTGTESPAIDSLIACDYVNDGMHNDNAQFESPLVSVAGGVSGIVGGKLGQSANSDRFTSLWGGDSITAVEVMTNLVRTMVFSNLRGILDTTSTVDLAHYDGVKSSNLVISYSVETGIKEDTTGTESNAADDGVGFISDFDGTPAADWEQMQMDTDIDEALRGPPYTHTWSTTQMYDPILHGSAGQLTSEVSGDTKQMARIGVEIVANLRVYMSEFPSATNPAMAFRLNTTTSTNIVIVPTGTGLVSDLTGSETLADDDEVGLTQTATAVGVTVRSTTQFIEIPSEVDIPPAAIDPTRMPMLGVGV